MPCPSKDATRVTALRMWLSHHRTASCIPPRHPADSAQTPATQDGVTTDTSQAVLSLAGNTGTVAEPNQPPGTGMSTLTGRRWRRSWVHCACALGRLRPAGPASACARPAGASSWRGTTWPGRAWRWWAGTSISTPRGGHPRPDTRDGGGWWTQGTEGMGTILTLCSRGHWVGGRGR